MDTDRLIRVTLNTDEYEIAEILFGSYLTETKVNFVSDSQKIFVDFVTNHVSPELLKTLDTDINSVFREYLTDRYHTFINNSTSIATIDSLPFKMVYRVLQEKSIRHLPVQEVFRVYKNYNILSEEYFKFLEQIVFTDYDGSLYKNFKQLCFIKFYSPESTSSITNLFNNTMK